MFNKLNIFSNVIPRFSRGIPAALFIAFIAFAAPARANDYPQCDKALVEGLYAIAVEDAKNEIPTEISTVELGAILANDMLKNMRSVDVRTGDGASQCRQYLVERTAQGGTTKAEGEDWSLDVNWVLEADENSPASVMSVAQLNLTEGTRMMYACGDHKAVWVSVEVAGWAALVVATVITAGGAGAVATAVGGTVTRALAANTIRQGAGILLRGAGSAVMATFRTATTSVARRQTAVGSATNARNLAHTKAVAARTQRFDASKAVNDAARTHGIGSASHVAEMARLETATTVASEAMAARSTAIAAETVAIKQLATATRYRTQQLAIAGAAVGAGTKAVWMIQDNDGKFQEFECGTINRENFGVGGKCYLACDSGWFQFDSTHKSRMQRPDDDLNNKVMMKLFNTKVCVDDKTFMLYEITQDGRQGKPFIINKNHPNYGSDEAFLKKIKALANTGECNWKGNKQYFFITQPFWEDDLTIKTDRTQDPVGWTQLN